MSAPRCPNCGELITCATCGLIEAECERVWANLDPPDRHTFTTRPKEVT